MRKLYPTLAALAAAILAVPAAQSETTVAGIPDRVVVLTSNNDSIHPTVMTVLYDTRDVEFQDLGAPRYLLVDREGTTALGIGGSVLAVGECDFDGAIGNNAFIPEQIRIPSAPGARKRFAFDVSHSTIFLKLVRRTRIGMLSAYVQTNFTGGDGGYGMKLKQAYVTLGNVTAGLANSTFSDPASVPPTIDYQGPAGQCSAKNVLLRYRRDFGNGFIAAAAVEMPKYDVTYGTGDGSAYKRYPDVPAYVQYEWDGARSHLRLGAIYRRLSYLDANTSTTRAANGWGVQLSGIESAGPVTIFGQATYGKGIAQYINDLSGAGFDLVPTTEAGHMEAPANFAMIAGLRFDITSKLFVSGNYSFCRLYDQRQLGPDTYQRGDYAVANIFYTPISDLQFGVEYVHGERTNVNGDSGTANRLEAMVKYFF